MWSKPSAGTEAPEAASQQTPARTASPTGTETHSFNAFNAPSSFRTSSSGATQSARLGASFQVRGSIGGNEDLKIDGVVEGPISLNGHELTVGPTAKLTSEIHAGEVVVYGKVIGNVHSKGRVDIKKDGSVSGDVDSARISIEDGAYFKGSIEIDPQKAKKNI
jgi:cytoskeletal protein CcmA (bactofilin family)